MAGHALMELRATPPKLRDIGAAGDRMAHQLLVGELNRLYPGVERPRRAGARTRCRRRSVVDRRPLTAHREFRRRGGRLGRPRGAGGRRRGGRRARGPLRQSTWCWPPETRPCCSRWCRGEPRVVVSRRRPPDVAYDVTEALGGVMIPMGSTGARWAVILGAAEVYVHTGRRYGGTRAPARSPWPASSTPAVSTKPLRYGDPEPGSPTWWSAASVRRRRARRDARQRRPYGRPAGPLGVAALANGWPN